MGLDSVELVMAWEDAFGIQIPDPVAETILTTADAVEYIHSRVGAVDGGRRWSRAEVREVVRAIIVEETGVKPGFADDAELFRDLGIN